MLKDLQEKLSKQGVDKTKRVLLAISGGVDSMVLWELFQNSEIPYEVAHVNFSLRGKESDGDEELVKKHAAECQVKLHLNKVDTNQYAKEHKVSIQMAARDIRYEWFEKLMKQHSINYLATAHHLNDSFESFLINLNRGTGLKGLLGIRQKQNIVRPLLDYSKEQISAFARENKLEYREDSSNSSLKYERNWFRHEIIDRWEKHKPDILKSMQHTFRRLQKTEELLNDFLLSETADLAEQMKGGKLSIRQILALKHSAEGLYFLLSPYGFTEDQLLSLFNCIREKQVGKQFNSKEYQLILDRDFVFVNRLGLQRNSSVAVIKEGQSELNHPKELSFKRVPRSEFKFNNDKNTEAFDFQKVDFPLELRKWREGDWMIPLGMTGKKKISDILIDEKVPIHLKESAYVICSNNNIIYLLNYRVDERYKIDAKTNEVFLITQSNT